MKQVDKISVSELSEMADKMYGNLVKGVVHLDKELLVVDAEMHFDEEQFLIENGSKQNSLWGINLYPEHINTDHFIEFDSMINIRPNKDNNSRSVENIEVQKAIVDLVLGKISHD